MLPNLPKKWFREPVSGHWVYTVDRFAADRGAAQVTLSIRAWVGDEMFYVRPALASLQTEFGTVGYMHETELPQWVQERMMVLNVADPETFIPQVGIRRHEPDTVEPQFRGARGYNSKSIKLGRLNRWYVLDCLTT